MTLPDQVKRERCPRDSDWCDGVLCVESGMVPGCPNADTIPCAYCPGDGEVCNPGNADPTRRVVDWLPPVICPRCGGTGKEPNPGALDDNRKSEENQ